MSLPKAYVRKLKESGRRTSPLLLLLSVLNFLNAGYPAFVSISFLTSPQPLENRWGVFVGLATVGMVGLGVCLLVRGQQAWLAASVCVLLLALHAAAVVSLGLSDTQGMGGGMLVFFGLVGTGLFSIVPVATLFLTLLFWQRATENS
jgi:hypothetical protein